MAKNQVPEKVPKYRFAVWNVWYKTVHLKVCKIVECEMLGIVCLRIKIALLEPVSPLNVLDRNGQQTDKKLQINDLWLFLLPESPASKTSKVR